MTGKGAFQLNFKFQAGDTLKLFDLRATNIYVTLQNSRLFACEIISSEGVSKLRFSFERVAIKPKRFANI